MRLGSLLPLWLGQITCHAHGLQPYDIWLSDDLDLVIDTNHCKSRTHSFNPSFDNTSPDY